MSGLPTAVATSFVSKSFEEPARLFERGWGVNE